MLLAGLKMWLLVMVSFTRRVRESGHQQGSGSRYAHRVTKALMRCVRDFTRSRLIDQDHSLECTAKVSRTGCTPSCHQAEVGRTGHVQARTTSACALHLSSFHCRVHMQALTWT